MSDRRTFLKDTTAITLASFLCPALLMEDNTLRFKNPGVQLYTFRKDMLTDAVGTLRRIAKLGIKEIESAGSEKGYYYGLSPKAMKDICADLGMTLRSGHIRIDDQWQKTLEDAALAGQEYLICSSMPSNGQTIDNYKNAADVFNKAAAQSSQLNIKFGYHNHDYEFEKENGKVLYDILVEHTDAKLVHLELDLGWVVAYGLNPVDYFKRYPGRFPLWHLKDMNPSKKESTEFGKGVLGIPELFKNAKLSGMKYFFIEQEEYASDPWSSMQHNMHYLKTL